MIFIRFNTFLWFPYFSLNLCNIFSEQIKHSVFLKRDTMAVLAITEIKRTTHEVSHELVKYLPWISSPKVNILANLSYSDRYLLPRSLELNVTESGILRLHESKTINSHVASENSTGKLEHIYILNKNYCLIKRFSGT